MILDFAIQYWIYYVKHNVTYGWKKEKKLYEIWVNAMKGDLKRLPRYTFIFVGN